jgi:hypothetical protein
MSRQVSATNFDRRSPVLPAIITIYAHAHAHAHARGCVRSEETVTARIFVLWSPNHSRAFSKMKANAAAAKACAPV